MKRVSSVSTHGLPRGGGVLWDPKKPSPGSLKAKVGGAGSFQGGTVGVVASGGFVRQKLKQGYSAA